MKMFCWVVLFFILNIDNFIFSQTTITLQPDSTNGKDAILRDLEPNTNHGKSNYYMANAWTWESVPGLIRSLLKFDLSGIPDCAQVLEANLSLYYHHIQGPIPQTHSSLSGSNISLIQRIIIEWEEDNVTWNTQPQIDTTNQVVIPQSTSPTQDYPNIDVTAIVQDMIENPLLSHGFLFRIKTEEHYRRMVFASTDHPVDSLHPKLVITFITCSINLGNDTTICFGDELKLIPGSNFMNYLWHDGSTDSIFIADTTGLYWVETTDSLGCIARDSINITILSSPEINLGNDTVVCHDESILLDPGFGFLSYLWQDGSSNQFLYANQTGSYWVQVMDDNSCYVYDTIDLEFVLPDPDIGSDTAICSGDSVTFFAADEFVDYLWQNGSDQLNFTTNSEGLIWCEVVDTLGCVGSDSVFLEILFPPVISLGNDTAFCVGDSLWLFAYPWNNEYDIFWQDGSSDSACMVWQEGEYWVMATNVCGTSTDSILISVEQLPWVYIGNDTILAMNSQIELNAGEGFESYLWIDGSELQTITISEGGSYWVNVFDGQCYNTDSIHIEPIECDLFIPIVFTPNWDGANDYFYAEVSKDITDFHLTVFNRWGEEIWEAQDKDSKWDGQRGATKADDGTYFWVLQYKCLASPIQFEKKGSVTLLR